MIKTHPSKDLIMIQVDNNMVQLNLEQQLKLFKVLKERLGEDTPE